MATAEGKLGMRGELAIKVTRRHPSRLQRLADALAALARRFAR